MKIGYERVSSKSQELARQTDALRGAGCEMIYSDKCSGASMDRPGLNEMIDHLRSGDTVYVLSLDRLSRKMADMLNLIEELNNMGVHVVSLKENISTEGAMGKFTMQIFAALAEFQRNSIKEAQAEGIEAAKERGITWGRPKTEQDKIDYALHLYDEGQYSAAMICKKTGISRSTLYRRLKDRDIISHKAISD